MALHRPTAVRLGADHDTGHGADPGRRRILVADDDTDGANLLSHLLTLHGFSVRTVFDGRQAVDAAPSFRPDLVILDLRMPVLDGFQAARALHRAHEGEQRLLLIALTGLQSVAVRDEAHAAGFDVVVPKAVDSAYLCDLVQGLIETSGPDATSGDPLDRVLTARRPLS